MINVLKNEPIIELEKLSIHDLKVEYVVKPRSNRGQTSDIINIFLFLLKVKIFFN